ncbi:hypothetical protein [Aestuariibacter sp. A3R04]|uniref:hypothetical protein n=1 Tax=Aestuariibacter sp. A3R04 TaxID=2841571 RepID=UPI001C0A340A|nr:hypothetical protein [Aestuariibacter sp. A3R04]MBU3020768.1 hypothetical protein [Aestuariibacter sp. A3R04]
MFTLRRQITALTIAASAALSAPAMAEQNTHSPLHQYLNAVVSQHITDVRSEINVEVAQLIASATYNAEPEISEQILMAEITVTDISAHAEQENSEGE